MKDWQKALLAVTGLGVGVAVVIYLHSRPKAPTSTLEGNYTTWTLQWSKLVQGDWGWGSFGAERIQVNEVADRLLMFDEGSGQRAVAKLSDGILIGTIVGVQNIGGAEFGTPMSFSKYYAEVIDTGVNYTLNMYKDTILQQTIDLNTVLSLDYTNGNYLITAFSNDGKYLTVSGYNWYRAGSATLMVALFKGG